MNIVDLSQRVEENQPLSYTAKETEIFTKFTHEERGYQVLRDIGEENDYVRRRLKAKNAGFEEEQPFQRTVTISEHGPTHVDAISHIDPTSDESIDNMSLERFYTEAVGIDVSHVEYPDGITADDIEQQLEAENLELTEGDGITIETGNWANNYSTTDKEKKYNYRYEFCGLTEDAAEFLVEQGVELIAMDIISVDNPANMVDFNYPVHSIAGEEELLLYENMANLGEVAGERFTFIGFPLKIRDGTASPVRAVAVVDD